MLRWLGFEFTSGPNPGHKRQMHINAAATRQIIANLLGNAIKFTEAGKVELRVLKYNNHFRFIVSDTGCGIGQDDLNHIFDPFWSRSKGASESSTGLGLNIVKRLVELMSGQITVESTEGAGTTFYIDLPFELAASVEAVTADSAKGALPSYFSGRVLLVDDNQTNLMLGKMILEKYGLSVRTASDGKEAVDIVSEVEFELVLMDISMPVMDGKTACLENKTFSIRVCVWKLHTCLQIILWLFLLFWIHLVMRTTLSGARNLFMAEWTQ